MFYKIDVLKYFAKTQKNICAGVLFNKVTGFQKEAPVQMFSSKFCKNFKNTYFIEHPRATAFAFWRSNNQNRCKKILHYKKVFLDTTKIYIY